jgi:hypothetical protein
LSPKTLNLNIKSLTPSYGMEDLAAKQRLRRPLGEDAARVASSDGGSAAVYGLDSTPAKGTQPAEGAQPRKATHPLATQAIAEHEWLEVYFI